MTRIGRYPHDPARSRISERQVRRLIASGGYKQHERQQISDEIRNTLWDLRGDVAKTARRLGIARSTLSDAVQLYVPATERAEMRSGEKAHRDAELYLPLEHEFIDCWQSDVKFVSIEVEDPITGKLVQPRVMHTKCPCARVVVGWYALLRNFQGEDIIEGTKRAMEIRHEDGPFGGTPRHWQLDNARSITARRSSRISTPSGLRPSGPRTTAPMPTAPSRPSTSGQSTTTQPPRTGTCIVRKRGTTSRDRWQASR